MKKILSIFSVVLFAFALTLSSCGDSSTDTDKASVECSGSAVESNEGAEDLGDLDMGSDTEEGSEDPAK